MVFRWSQERFAHKIPYFDLTKRGLDAKQYLDKTNICICRNNIILKIIISTKFTWQINNLKGAVMKCRGQKILFLFEKWEQITKHRLAYYQLIFRCAVAKDKKCNNIVPTKGKFMDVSIIAIGNSKGIRLSKALLEKYNITDEVELILEKDYIILKPKAAPRDGWENAFKKMHENGDDHLLIDDVFEDENLEEWS